MVEVFMKCTSVSPMMRPPLEEVKKSVTASYKHLFKGKSIVDHMMAMMERYAGELETLVQERTQALEEAQKRADRLLYQLMPRSIANALKAGTVVPPELYESASICFVDIVGFTSFCSQSSPMQIVHTLNELFTSFDALLAAADVYKVEFCLTKITICGSKRSATPTCA